MPGKRSRRKLAEYSSGSSEDDDGLYDSSEPSDSSDTDTERVFCKCGEPNSVHMIGCDGQTCHNEWHHFQCVGIDPKNIPSGRWLCEDCRHKEEKEEELHRIPFGQFVLPVTDPNKQNDVAKEEENRIPSDPVGLLVPDPGKKQNNSEKESDSPVPSASISCHDASKVKKACDATLTKSLSEAEKQLASNLKQACHAVIHEGKSVGDAATFFCVGRYVLGDCVKDQLRLNLTNACQDVISKRYTVEKAALVYGVIPGILEERVKVEKDALRTVGSQSSQSMSSSFKENLQQACMDIMSSRCTLSEAGRIYRIHSATLKSKLKTVLVLTTAEENDLVKMCIKMAVLGHSTLIKSAVMSKVRALLEDEERRGIKRIHSFPDNMPDNFWWESFRSRHPEFKSISYDESSQAAPDVILKQSCGQPTNQIFAQKNVVRELRPKPLPSTLDEVYYILPTPRVSNEQLILVKQNILPDNQVSPITDTISEVVSPLQSNASSQPEPVAAVSNFLQDDQQSSDNNINSSSLSHPSVEAADSNIIQSNPDGSTVETGDLNSFVVAKEVHEGCEVSSFRSSEMEQPSLVLGANEVTVTSLNVAGEEVVQTDVAGTNKDAQPDSVIGDDDLPQLKIVVAGNQAVQTGQAFGSELSQPNDIIEANPAGQHDQGFLNEVIKSGLTTANDNAVANPDAPAYEASEPGMNENPSLIIGAGEGIQPSQNTGPTEKLVAGDAAQPDLTTADGTVWSNLATTQAVHSNRCVVAASNQVVQQCFVGPSTVFVAANQIVQPGQVILRRKILQPNLVISGNQALPQNYLVTVNRAGEPNSIGSVSSCALAGANKVVQPSKEPNKCQTATGAEHGQNLAPGGIPGKEMQAYLDATGGNKDTPLVLPEPVSPALPRPSSQDTPKSSGSTHKVRCDMTGVFVAKHKIDKSLPDALTCLEKTLTKEQKESFAFRLQIGDDRRDDTLYNAWKALKRLYHHKDIHGMYSKQPPHVDRVPPTFDLPVASKLMRSSSLMDVPVGGQANSEHGCNILAELRRGRKRRRITSKLARREADGMRQKDIKRFLEPWKYEIKKPNKRKNGITRFAGNGLLTPLLDDTAPSEAEAEIQDQNEN